MTNEWGPPLTGEEMKTLNGRIDPETYIMGLVSSAPYKLWFFGLTKGAQYHLPANHPYYKVREYNQKHGTNLVLHDGSAKVPDDFAPGIIMFRDGDVCGLEGSDGEEVMMWRHSNGLSDIIAYTPKPKESEVTEAMPSNEALKYTAKLHGVEEWEMGDLSSDSVIMDHARLIQQYEPDRLKPAVDIAARDWLKVGFLNDEANASVIDGNLWYETGIEAFKAGAAWQKENGNV